MRFIIVPYKMGSQSCKRLKEKFIEVGHKALQIKPTNRTFRPKITDKYIYWGGSAFIGGNIEASYNSYRTVASNKLNTFKALTQAGLSTVPWTEEREIANEWLTEGKTVVARATLVGHSGAGITIHTTPTDLPTVSLYTKYVKKTYECRIHIFKGRMIDAQIKRKIRDVEENNPLIRNIHTGWVYCRDNYIPDPTSIQLAIDAVQAVGLDFGAVDLIYNQHYNQFYILEVNTAPGLEGTTLINYVNALIGDLN